MSRLSYPCLPCHASPSGRRVACFVVVLAVVVAGCVTEQAATPKRPWDDPQISAPQSPPQEVIPPPAPQAPPAPTPPAAALNPTRTVPTANLDPCAVKLHDLCAPLLLHFSLYGRPPQSLAELRQIPGFEDIGDFTCPTSRRPYIYTPQGEPGPDDELIRENAPPVKVASYILLADPTPVHSGTRYAIAISEPQENQGIVAKVIVLPAK